MGACCALFGEELGPNLTQCRLGRGLPPYHLNPLIRFATTDMGRKLGVCVPFLEGSWVLI